MWHAGVVFVEEWLALRGTTPRWLWQESPDRLTPAEQSVVDGQGRVQGPVELGSAVLRRAALWRSASWLTAWASQGLWLLEWPAGPARSEVVSSLLHPLFGLPGSFRHDETGQDTASLVDEESGSRLMLRTVERPEESPDAPTREWPEEFFRPWHRWAELTASAK
nr:hypothetical protein GCM10020241_60670 [Streptoalloteichus tenebrarius]